MLKTRKTPQLDESVFKGRYPAYFYLHQICNSSAFVRDSAASNASPFPSLSPLKPVLTRCQTSEVALSRWIFCKANQWSNAYLIYLLLISNEEVIKVARVLFDCDTLASLLRSHDTPWIILLQIAPLPSRTAAFSSQTPKLGNIRNGSLLTRTTSAPSLRLIYSLYS